jgi:DNA helicase IV
VSELFPDLADERRHLVHAHRCRQAMVRRLTAIAAGDGAADEITQEYIEMVVADALADLAQPGAGDFFGRIDEDGGPRWYVGRRHIEDERHDPVVVDWRAAVAAPFYRATVHDPLGLRMRRRFTLAQGELTAYLDEHLDDPQAADVAGGIPDPVLAEIGAARTGEMREIVATIQAEQDHIIRAPFDRAVIVQGGPGTGKTAVGLHRAAYLLFEHRHQLSRDGVLVVGPNRVFLDYIANVLPSLGERSVQQRTIGDLAVPRVEVTAEDSVAAARVKGAAVMATVIERAALAQLNLPAEAIREPLGATSVVVEPAEIQSWIDAALAGNQPLNRRREAVRAVAEQALRRRTGRDEIWSLVPAIRAALARAWPVVRPRPLVERLLSRPEVLADVAGGLLTPAEQELVLTRRGRAKQWTPADQVLLDTASSLLNGPLATFGHVVVDEAQDLSALALAAVARRCPRGSLTVLGDLAQSTGAAGQSSWEDVIRFLGVAPSTAVEHLTIGYRVPAPILDVANRLLPATGVDVPASRSVRREGQAPAVRRSEDPALGAAEEVVALRRHHALTGVIAPERWLAPIAVALVNVGLTAVGHVQGLAAGEVPVLGYELVKGLELDGIVVVSPEEVLDGTERGARLVYVALTRAVQALTIVTSGVLPELLGLGSSDDDERDVTPVH